MAQVALVVAPPLTWLLLIATRRWHPEPSWIDRLGRVLRVLGMICTPAHLVLIRLPYRLPETFLPAPRCDV